MKSKLEIRKKNKRAFIVLSLFWLCVSLFCHIAYMTQGTISYWPIYPILFIGVAVCILGIIVFRGEYKTSKDEETQLSKAPPPHLNKDSQNRALLNQNGLSTSNISYIESELV